LRTAAEQEEMLKSGASWVSRSKHQDGKAVDFGIWRAGLIDWNDHAAYREVACHIKEVAARLNIKIVWGGDWKKRDMVHIEIA
jgi:peptidoglycan L-alanyl-D-glutamate endopeptidase CwlK